MLPIGEIISLAETSYSGNCGDNTFWELDPTLGCLTISGEGTMHNFSSNGAPWSEYSYKIKKIVLTSGVKNIGDNSFSACRYLTSVLISDTVESIGTHAFERCSSLLSIDIPSTVKTIEYSAFRECGKLTSITLHEGLQKIGAEAFRETAISSLYIPSTVENLYDYNSNYGRYAGRYNNIFQYCDKLSEIEVGEGNPNYEVKNGALYNKKSNVLITAPKKNGKFSVPEGTKWIASYSFRNCTGMTEIILPTSVEVIGENAFEGCSSVQDMIIPEGVERIGAWAFSKCSSLETISFPSTVTEIYIDELTFYRNYKLYSLNVSANNEYYSSKDGMLYNKDKTILYACAPKKVEN